MKPNQAVKFLFLAALVVLPEGCWLVVQLEIRPAQGPR